VLAGPSSCLNSPVWCPSHSTFVLPAPPNCWSSVFVQIPGLNFHSVDLSVPPWAVIIQAVSGVLPYSFNPYGSASALQCSRLVFGLQVCLHPHLCNGSISVCCPPASAWSIYQRSTFYRLCYGPTSWCHCWGFLPCPASLFPPLSPLWWFPLSAPALVTALSSSTSSSCQSSSASYLILFSISFDFF